MAKLYEIAFKIAGGISPEFSKSFQTAGKAMAGLGAEARRLSEQASQIGAIARQRQKVGEAARAYEEASRRAAELGRAMAQAAQPTRAMQREFERARQAASRSKEALAAQRQTLRQMEQAAGTAGQSIQSLTRREKELASAAEKARSEQARLAAINARIGNARQGLKAHAAGAGMAGAAAGAGALAAAKTGMDFETAMANVGAVSRANAEDMAALTGQARKLGETTRYSASQAAEGMKYLAMAGFKTEQILKTMPGMLSLASAAATDLGTTADITSNILTGFGLDAGQMDRVADVLTNTFTSSNSTLESLGETMKYAAPVAKSMGVSIEYAAAMAGKLHDAGIQGTMAGTGLRAVLLRLAAPAKQGAQAMAKIGLQTKDANGNMRNYNDLLVEIAQKTANMASGERTELLKKIFGTEAVSSAMVLIEQASTGALKTYSESLARAGSAAETANRQQDNLQGSLWALQSASEAVRISLYDTVKGPLREFADKATAIVQSLNAWIQANPETARTIMVVAGAVGALAAAAIPLALAIHTVGFAVNAAKLAFGGLQMAGGLLSKAFQLIRGSSAAAAAGMTQTTAAMTNTGRAATAAAAGVRQTSAAMTSAGSAATSAAAKTRGFFSAMNPAGKAFGIVGMIYGSIEALKLLGGALDAVVTKLAGAETVQKLTETHEKFERSTGMDLNDASDADIAAWASGETPALAAGGIATRPTAALIAEGGEPEAVIPLSRLASMLPAGQPSVRGGGVTVNFSPNIQISGQGGDAYAQTSRALSEGATSLRRELERMFQDQRRLAYF